jgi:LacI family transcriptional regulator
MVQAVRFIRDHSDQPISVRDVLKAVPISRRQLEIRLKELLGRTPRQEINHSHIARAKMLMENVDLSLAEIADLSGFKAQSMFSIVFKRLTKSTPAQYRKRLSKVKPTSPSRKTHLTSRP